MCLKSFCGLRLGIFLWFDRPGESSSEKLSRSHHHSLVNCVWSVYGISVSGQLNRDVIGYNSNQYSGNSF